MPVSEENYDPTTGLLSAVGLERALDAELSRAARHELPLALVYFELVGLALAGENAAQRRLVAGVAEALLGGVRAEDRVARVGDLRFAVLATEAGEAHSLAERLAEHVNRHVRKLRAEAEEVFVVAAAVDCLFDELTKAELLTQAERELSLAILQRERTGSDGDDAADAPSSPNGLRQAG